MKIDFRAPEGVTFDLDDYDFSYKAKNLTDKRLPILVNAYDSKADYTSGVGRGQWWNGALDANIEGVASTAATENTMDVVPEPESEYKFDKHSVKAVDIGIVMTDKIDGVDFEFTISDVKLTKKAEK